MAGEWPKKPLGGIVQNFDARRIPLSGREREKRRGPFPYHGATGVMDHVDDYLFEGLHLLIAEDGSVERPDGKPFLQLVSGRFWVNNHAHVVKGATDQDTKYLYFALSAVPIRPYVSGSVQAKLSQSNLNRIPISYPSQEADRCAIAHILGALDDKIELNHRRNQTLEAMARALFKDWFVDFGPVRAKMEGREPYLPADLWQLFPDRLDDEGKPEGWEEVAAESVADIGIGKTPPRKEHQWFSTFDSDMRWVSIRDMGDSGVFLQSTSEYLTREAVDKFNVRVVPDNTVILSFKLTVGRVAITDGEMVTNEAIAHLKIGDQSRLSTEYLYSYLREFDYGRLGSTSSIATAVNSKSIKALPVLVPTNDLAGQFARRIMSIFARIKHLQSEATTLAQLRDTLLPKLISGELRIADAEKFLKGVRL